MQEEQITETEKRLYNAHLAISRSIKNKPFKNKKDFSDIVKTDKIKFLKRISTLFNKHPEIDPSLFFSAPYRLYPDVEYFGLDYFSTMRAIKAYTNYKKTIFLQNPDSQLESVKESLQFIANYCIQNNIYFHQYPYQRKSDLYVWMTHYKQNKINIYSVMEFSDIFSSAKSLAEDLQKMFVSDFVDKFQTLYLNYQNSQKLKPYIQKAIPLLSNFVQRELTKPKTNLL